MDELLVLRGNYTFYPNIDEQVQIEQTPVEELITKILDKPSEMPIVFHELWRTRRDTDIYELFKFSSGPYGFAATMCDPEYLTQRIASMVVSKNVPEITNSEQFRDFLQDLYATAIKVEEQMHLNETETEYMKWVARSTAQGILFDANTMVMLYNCAKNSSHLQEEVDINDFI